MTLTTVPTPNATLPMVFIVAASLRARDFPGPLELSGYQPLGPLHIPCLTLENSVHCALVPVELASVDTPKSRLFTRASSEAGVGAVGAVPRTHCAGSPSVGCPHPDWPA